MAGRIEIAAGDTIQCCDFREREPTRAQGFLSEQAGQDGAYGNPWGLFDMTGNVMEFTRGGLREYGAAPVVDPFGMNPTESGWAQARGGSSTSGAIYGGPSPGTCSICGSASRTTSPRMNKLTANATERDSRKPAIWDDDAVEIFLCPDKSRQLCYQFIINASGAILDGKHRDILDADPRLQVVQRHRGRGGEA